MRQLARGLAILWAELCMDRIDCESRVCQCARLGMLSERSLATCQGDLCLCDARTRCAVVELGRERKRAHQCRLCFGGMPRVQERHPPQTAESPFVFRQIGALGMYDDCVKERRDAFQRGIEIAARQCDPCTRRCGGERWCIHGLGAMRRIDEAARKQDRLISAPGCYEHLDLSRPLGVCEIRRSTHLLIDLTCVDELILCLREEPKRGVRLGKFAVDVTLPDGAPFRFAIDL